MFKIWGDDEIYNGGYTNYGDVDFFENGILVNTEYDDKIFRMLVCKPYPCAEDKYVFGDIQIDTDDPWIDRDAVMAFIGMTDGSYDAVEFAIGCVDYYGIENFGPQSYAYDYTNMTRKEIEWFMRYKGIDLNSYKNEPEDSRSPYVREIEKAVSDMHDAADKIRFNLASGEPLELIEQGMEAVGRIFGGEIAITNYPYARRMLEKAEEFLIPPVTSSKVQEMINTLAEDLIRSGMLPQTAEQKAFREHVSFKYNAMMEEEGGGSELYQHFLANTYRDPDSRVKSILTREELKKYREDPIVKNGDIYRKEKREIKRQRAM